MVSLLTDLLVYLHVTPVTVFYPSFEIFVLFLGPINVLCLITSHVLRPTLDP